MNKITTLSLFLLAIISSFGQSSNFESSTTLPLNWSYQQNTLGQAQFWKITNLTGTPPFVCQGLNAAFIDRENVGAGNSSEDYLVTNQFVMPTNAELKFLSRQGTAGDQGGVYKIMVSTNASAAVLASYTTVVTYTEQQMNTDFSVCQEQVVNLSAYSGQTVYLAFVKIATQSTNAIVGDRWYLDDVRVFEKCQDPTLGTSSNLNATTATLSWTNAATANLWDIAIIPSSTVFTGVPTTSGITSSTTGTTKTYQATGLLPNTSYQYYVRNVCALGTSVSAWSGPYNFITLPLGSVCVDPIVVGALPYQTLNNTANFGDYFDTAQSTAASCGATPATTNYLAGNEVFYTYTATTTGQINIQSTPTGPNSSVFVYPGCPISGACLAGAANTGSGTRTISNFPVTAGQTYTIVLSSAAATQTFGYTLLIQQEACAAPFAGTATGITLTSANLSWSNPLPAATAWEVFVQPLGGGVPTTAGVPATMPYTASNLTAATQYQYWVRAACPTPGVFSVWSGPYPFNTLLCAPADQCLHTFTMRNTIGTGGWNGATMEIKQNNIVVATIGSSFVSGSTASQTVALCNGLPFEVFWKTAGTQPAQVALSIFNSFTQNIFNKAAGQSAAGQIVYTNQVNCITPVCTIAPISLTATSITTSTASIGWTAIATTNWDVFLVPFGSPAPTATSIPTYSNINTNPLPLTGLAADTQYTVYVRVVCSPLPSDWSTGINFTTLPTCIKPTALNVGTITTTSASFVWTNGLPTHNAWEILLVPSLTTTLPAQLPLVNPVLTPGMILLATTTVSPVIINTLTPATIYYYYIRTVCSTSDKSTWAGPFVFNTLRCDLATEACVYRFIMSDTASNTWNGATMQIRQNGIVVATLSTQLVNGNANNTTGFAVQLCKDINFDLVWNNPGTAPNEIGIVIVDRNGDPVYTKLPGQGAVSSTPLYSSTVNCNLPTCPKPTALTAIPSQTTAQVGWTEMGTATQWEVYVQPSTPTPVPPVNGSPLNNNVAPYYTANSNPFTLTGLLPQTAYTFWVRAICSPTNVSNWTLINPGPRSFFTTPINDACDFAINVPVSPTQVCPASITQGNTIGATPSTPLNLPGTGCGTSDDDVWFKFTATSTTHVIKLNNIVGIPTTVTLNHTLFSGSCTNLQLEYCSNLNTSVAVSLTVGATYFVRVYTAGSTAGQSAKFEICVRTPPTITNNECANALTATSNNGLVCNIVTAGSLTGATASGLPLIAAPCVGNPDDDVWFKFVATANNHFFSLTNVTGTTTNLNFAVYEGVCSALTLKFCSVTNSLQGNNNTFVIGQTYFVRVWSNSAVREDVQFNLCIGRILPPVVVSTTQYNTQQLIEDVFLGTTCATVTNITSSTGNNFGSTNGIGYFNGLGTEFPYQNGIVLVTGSALKVPGPNSTILSDGNQAWSGDADLEAIVLAETGQAMNSRNATKLEFDFIPIKNQLKLNFLFASEEYGTFQCSFSDSFAFLLRNNTTNVTTNIAVIPQTSTPISVVTIRDAIYNNGCASVNPTFFGAFYGANGVNPLGAPVNFNGVTVPMEATAAVIPGQSYHIKMVIADRSDNSYDSAIFLKGGSFDIGNIDFGGDYLQSAGNAICQGECITLNSNIDTTLFNIKWFKDGVVIAGAVSSSIQVCDQGVYKIEATFNSFSSCVLSDTITIEYFQEPQAASPTNLVFCGTATTNTFDLTVNTPIVLTPFTIPHTVSYFLTAADAISNVNAISNTTSFINTSNPQTIHVRIKNNVTNCLQFSNFQLKLQDLTPVYSVSGSLQVCANGNTTMTVVPTNNNFDVNSPNVSYVWTLNGNIVTTATSSTLVIDSSQAGNYTVTVNNSGCKTVKNFIISVTNVITGNISYPNAQYCKTSAIIATPTPGFPSGGTFQSTIGLTIDPTTGLVTPSSSVAGQYVVSYVYPSYGGCPGFTLTTNIEITNATTANFSYAQTVYCRVLGSASPIFASGSAAGIFTSIPSGLSINASTGVINTAASAPGTYQVVNDIVALGGCAATSSSTTVTITAAATGTITYATPFCKSSTIAQNVVNTAPLGGVYATTSGLSLNTSTGVIQPSTSTPGQYVVSYSLPAVGGCSIFVATTTVTVIPVSDVALQGGCKGTQYVIEASPVSNSFNPGTATYLWTSPSGQVVASIVGQANAIVATTQGIYTVVVTTPDGCKSTQTVAVSSILCSIQKGISPNADGKNDTFDLTSLNVKLLEIYNRYGTLVYSLENYTNQWGGQSSTGMELPDATYFYVIQKADGTAGITGWIYINRQQ